MDRKPKSANWLNSLHTHKYLIVTYVYINNIFINKAAPTWRLAHVCKVYVVIVVM